MRAACIIVVCFLVSVLASSCTKNCTLVGCLSGVELTVRDASGNVLESFSGVVRATGEAEVAFSCPRGSGNGVRCLGASAVIDLETKPTSFDVEITQPVSSRQTYTVTGVTWREFYPNGEECDVNPCRNADATITLEN